MIKKLINNNILFLFSVPYCVYLHYEFYKMAKKCKNLI